MKKNVELKVVMLEPVHDSMSDFLENREAYHQAMLEHHRMVSRKMTSHTIMSRLAQKMTYEEFRQLWVDGLCELMNDEEINENGKHPVVNFLTAYGDEDLPISQLRNLMSNFYFLNHHERGEE